MSDALTKSERETLKSIYRLSRDGEEAHTGALAEALGVSPGTATATVKRLAERGLLDHRPYRGVELTKAYCQSILAATARCGRQLSASCSSTSGPGLVDSPFRSLMATANAKSPVGQTSARRIAINR